MLRLARTSRYFAGHFVVKGMTRDKLDVLMTNFYASMNMKYTELYHREVGWN